MAIIQIILIQINTIEKMLTLHRNGNIANGTDLQKRQYAKRGFEVRSLNVAMQYKDNGLGLTRFG